MPRKRRVHYPGAIYHVIVRGNKQLDIFVDNEDFRKYLFILKDYLTCSNARKVYIFIARHLLHLPGSVVASYLSVSPEYVPKVYQRILLKRFPELIQPIKDIETIIQKYVQ
ncbi:MAG: hypothetical protein KGZ79_15650 [Dethiobacter sp.]|jgi:hypothetical protein|nr:hypothetical protein [Dethiobacter sp.]